jgi:hypothetical protein
LAQRKDWIDRQIINPVVERLYGTVAFRGKDPVSITQSIQSMYDTSAAFENLDTLRDHKDYRQYITALLLEIGSKKSGKTISQRYSASSWSTTIPLLITRLHM